MDNSKIIVSIIFFALGLFFFFNNKNVGKGTYKLYQLIYTEKNLIVIFRIVGVVLVVGGILLLTLG